MGAEAELFNNVSVVAQLVSKLSASHQDRWHQDKTSTDFRNDQRKLGEKFLAWLEGQGAAANSARLTQQALALTTQPLISPPMPRCGACGKGGHKTENCLGGEGRGKHWGLAREQGACMEQELAGNAFATSGTAYPSGQRAGSPPMEESGPSARSSSPRLVAHQEWKQKMGTEEGSKETKT